MSSIQRKWFSSSQLSIGLLVTLLLVSVSHAQDEQACGLAGAWEVYDSYPQYPEKPGNIEQGDTLYLAGDESDNWTVILESESAQSDMVPICDSVSKVSKQHLKCRYDDSGKKKTFTVDLIKTREMSESECRDKHPARPDNMACAQAACVIKWQNETVADARVKILSPPNDGDGTGGKD